MSTPKTLLAGPILRNVSPSKIDSSKTNVSVFVATSKSDQVKLDLYEKNISGSTPIPRTQLPNPIASTVAKPLQIGEKLFVLVISLSASMSSGIQYYYNITIGANEDLAQMGLLQGNACLGYDENVLPSFILPAQDKNNLHIFHASCRKHHGQGRDALAILDGKIKDQLNDPIHRPQQLFLTGDQIYADDVDPLLLTWIMEEGYEYIYGQIPNNKKETLGGFVYPTIDDLPIETGGGYVFDMVMPNHRKKFIKEKTGFSSNESENHLLYLADFLMMYMFAWSPEVWPQKTDGSFLDLKELAASHPLIEKKAFNLGQVHQVELENYFKALPFVRRALANIPTYMIFDDHEVSDDWVIHQKWLLDVSRSSDGSKVVCNALLAYALFQDWGNEAPESTPKYQVKDEGARLLIDNTVSWERTKHDHNTTLMDYLGANASTYLGLGGARSKRIQWSYRISFYCHQIMALDTRTNRDVYAEDISLLEKAPQLIKESNLDLQVPEASPTGTNLFPIVLSPTPILGYPFIEQFLQPNLVKGTERNEKYDNESWATSVKSKEEVLQNLSTYEKALILSGDVHYSFSNQTSYFDERSSSEKRAKIVQLCSSSLHNTEWINQMLSGSRDWKSRMVPRWFANDQNYSMDYIGYLDKEALGDLKAKFTPSRWNLLWAGFTLKSNYASRMAQLISHKEAPPLVMQKFKDSGKNLKTIRPNPNHPIKWRYRVVYIVDQDLQLKRQCIPSVDIPERIAGHKNYALFNYPDPVEKEIVGANNIGEVIFDNDTVHHYLHRYSDPKLDVAPKDVHLPLEDLLKKGITTIIHTASLAIPQDSEKPEGFVQTARSPT